MPSYHGLIPGNFYQWPEVAGEMSTGHSLTRTVGSSSTLHSGPSTGVCPRLQCRLLTCFTLATSRIKDSSST